MATGKVKVIARLGNETFESFTIDVTTRRHTDVPVDWVPLRAIIVHETLRDLPSAPTTPVENHLADKICALYERHGHENSASSRYRDLADIVRIVDELSFTADRLATVLQRESGRRRVGLPQAMEQPGPRWGIEFRAAAATFAEFPRRFWNLDASLTHAGACLDEILAGSRVSGSWSPENQAWI